MPREYGVQGFPAAGTDEAARANRRERLLAELGAAHARRGPRRPPGHLLRLLGLVVIDGAGPRVSTLQAGFHFTLWG